MNTTHVLVDFFHTRSQGYFEGVQLSCNAALVYPEKKSVNQLSVCTLEDGDNRSKKISSGMKQAHKDAQEFMAENYGDDWKKSASYIFGYIVFY